MKYYIILILTLQTLLSTAQPTSNSYDLSSMEGLNRVELYQKYAYDDTSRALINKFYSSQLQAAALIGISSVLTVGLFISSHQHMSIGYYFPAGLGLIGFQAFLLGGTIGSLYLIPTKAKLLDSLKYYKEKGVLKKEDRRLIRSYMSYE